MAQYRAGYYINNIQQLFQEADSNAAYQKLLAHLSVFNLEMDPLPEAPAEQEPLAAVATNIITRGTPTRASETLHEVFRKAFRHVNNWSGVFFTDNPDSPKLREQVLKALHVIDPRLTKKSQTEEFQQNWDRFGQEHREEFFYHLVPEYLGSPFLQLLEQDLDIQTLLEFSKAPENDKAPYQQKRTKEKIASALDLSMEFPYPVEGRDGMAFEIRDARKEKLEQRNIDSLRDDAIRAAGWMAPYRYRTTDFSSINKKLQKLKPLLESDFISTISENFNHPLYQSEGGLDAMQLALSPLLVARMQRTWLEFLHKGVLGLKDQQWNLAVIERDVPAAVIALQDLLEMLAHLRYLREGTSKLPEINLTVFYTEAFAEHALNTYYTSQALPFSYERKPLSAFSAHTAFDVLVDASILQRRAARTPTPDHKAAYLARIRSIHTVKSYQAFVFDKRIRYPHTGDEKARESLAYFLQIIFRKAQFLPGQAELLQGILSQQNMLGILPPHGGKSIIQQLAALLQPAPSVSIIPSSHLAVDQELEQSNDSIFIASRHSMLNQPPEQRQRIRRHFLNRRILLLYVYAGDYQSKQFRELLGKASQAFEQSGYAFIDEVHCLSQWSHDFRPSYFNLATNITTYMGDSRQQAPAIMGLTSAASYTTLFDIMRALKIGREQVIDKSEISGSLKYKFIKIKNKEIFYNTPIAKAIEKTAMRKQLQLVQLLEKIYSEPSRSWKNQKTLIICPDNKGVMGITNEAQNGIADKLRNHFDKLAIREFTGSYEHLQHQTSMRSSEQTLKNLAEARLNRAQIIIATEDMAIGINTPGIQHIIYMNMPASVEKFSQINGRAIRKKREGNIYLLYNDQPIQHDGSLPETFLAHGNMDDKAHTTPDQYLNLKSLSRNFSSASKEIRIIQELLTEISFPEECAEDLIAEAIENEYGVNVSLNYHPANNPYQLYINHSNKTFGHIDYRSYSIMTDNATLDPELGAKILEFTRKEIERLMPETENVFKWLRQSVHQNAIPGIEKIFAKISDKEEASLSIHFRNKALATIASKLKDKVSQRFTEKKVRECYLAAPAFDRFIRELEKISSLKTPEGQKQDFIKELQSHYQQVREMNDTFAAVRRLVSIGAIDDFTIDYHSRMFNLVISPKSTKTYMVKLRNYLAHYISPAEADAVFDEFQDYEGETPLQKSAGKLVRFIYNRMVPYHLQGIKRMGQLPAAAGSDEEQQNNVAVYLRFHSRALYANPYITPNLRTDTNDLEEAKYKILLKYFKQAGDFRENWQHLVYSTEILLREAPENYVIKILNAYASMLLYKTDEERFFRAYDYLTEGAIRMYQTDNISYQDFMSKLNIIVKKLYEKDPGLQETVEPILNLKIHNEWLKSFNKGFLDGYEENYKMIYPH